MSSSATSKDSTCCNYDLVVAVVQVIHCVQFSMTPSTAAHQVSLPFTVSQGLLRFMSIESVRLSNHLMLCHPSPFAFSLSQHHGLFQ